MTEHNTGAYPMIPCNIGYGYNSNNEGIFHILNGQKDIVDAGYRQENDIRHNLDTVEALITNGVSSITANVTTVSRDVLNAQQNISQDISNVRQEIATNRFQLLEVNNDLTKQLAGVMLEQSKTNAQTREEMLKGFAATQLDACKNTAEITRQASDLAASLAKQIAECCCETKQLFAQSEINRLRDQLTASEKQCNSGALELTIRNIINNSAIARA